MTIFWDFYRAFRQSRQWDFCLEELLGDEAIYGPVRQLNDRRKSLGVSGLGTAIFGEVFGIDVEPIVANVTSGFNFFTAYVDGYLDGADGFDYRGNDSAFVSTILDDSFTYLQTGETNNDVLRPLEGIVFFIRKHVLQGDLEHVESFFGNVRGYAKSVEDELNSNDVKKRLSSRVDIGTFYGRISSDLIDIFSSGQLSETERRAIEIFSACATVFDDYIDVFEDGQRSYVILGSEGIYDRFLRLHSHRELVQEMYLEGECLLEGNPSQARYRSMFNRMMLVGDLLFLKRGVGHYASKLAS